MTSREAARRRRAYDYNLYGLCLRSEWPLPYPPGPASHLGEVGLFRGSRSGFSKAIKEARTMGDQAMKAGSVPLADGRTYLQWPDHVEFLISADGRAIAARPLGQTSHEAFHSYLLGQALSFALVKQGLEPLHATAVAISGTAVAFLGESGYGKSSLGAAFLRAGDRLLTDDLLVLSAENGRFTAHPGPPRIKLFPEMARSALGSCARGTRLTKATRKLLIPLDERHAFGSAALLRAIYVLAPPSPPGRDRTKVRIRRLSKRQACLALLRNSFNTAITDPRRLTSQLALAANVAATVPVRAISYPRAIGMLPDVRKAILVDLSRDGGPVEN